MPFDVLVRDIRGRVISTRAEPAAELSMLHRDHLPAEALERLPESALAAHPSDPGTANRHSGVAVGVQIAVRLRVARRGSVRSLVQGRIDLSDEPFSSDEDVQTLVPGGCGEPTRQLVGVSQFAEVLDHSQPGVLHGVAGVRLAHAERPDRRPDNTLVPVDELLDGPRVTGPGVADELRRAVCSRCGGR
jgi:hypothetical protein